MTAFKSRAEVERMVEACVMPGVTELAPVPGFTYHAFAVHPPIPGLVFGFAIAHHDRDQDHIVLDIVRENISVAESARLMRRYGISTVVGALDEGDGCSLAHAACGAMVEAKEGAK